MKIQNRTAIVPAIEGEPIALPRMARVHQSYDDRELRSIPEAVQSGMRILPQDLSGKRIALTVGSRGIDRIDQIAAAVIGELRARGAEPFIIPAMGSHAGATPEGQRAFIAGYGVSEETMGVPVCDSMETVCLGTLENGVRVFCQKDAWEADGIIVMNKIKPHADFKGPIESGLCKMMVIGLGKHMGATEVHRRGFARMPEILPAAAALFLEKAPVLLGIGIIENAYDRLMDLRFVRPEELIEQEKNMLLEAKANIARLQVSSIDLLIIGQIGKNISGEGMDPNVTGRPGSYLMDGFEAPPVQKIAIFRVTEESHGNGVGIGMADVTTAELIEGLDLSQIYTNAVTSTLLAPAKLPLIAKDERAAVDLALRTCYDLDPARGPRIVWIRDTSHLGDIYVSEAYREEIEASENMTFISEFREMDWDEEGHLVLE